MRPDEALALVHDVEARFEVDKWAVDGVRVWPLVRRDLVWAIEAADSRRAPDLPGARRTPCSIVRTTGLSARQLLRRAQSEDRPIAASSNVVFFGDDISRSRLGGTWYDELLDPLRLAAESLGLSTLHLEHGREARLPRFQPIHSLQLSIDILKLASRFRARRTEAHLGSRDLSGYADFQRLIDPLDLPADFGAAAVAVRAASINSVARLLEKILRRTGATLALVNTDGPLAMALYLAARRAGVVAVQVQHGVIAPIHWSGGAWLRVPSEGFELLPEVFWAWSDREASLVREWAPAGGRHRVVVGGHPWLAYWRWSADPVIAKVRADIAATLAAAGGDVHILVTLQGGIATRPWLEHLRRIMTDSPRNWRWWVRSRATMSPSELADVRGLLASLPGVDVEAATNFPMYGMLEHVQVHVTAYSTCTLEAAVLRVPTVALDSYAAAWFPELAALGWLVAAGVAAEVRASISAQLQRAPGLNPPDLGRDGLLLRTVEDLARDSRKQSDHARA